jgi:predicted transcriptional regulator
MARHTSGGVPKEILAEREVQVWTLRQKGYTHQRIADEIGLERSTVTKMVHRITGRVVNKLDEVVKEQIVIQVEQLSFIVDEMFQAWQRSKEAQKSVSKKTIAGGGRFNKAKGEELTVETEDQDGNERYSAEARAAMADIRKILGIDAATKIEQSGNVGLRVEYVNDWRDHTTD